MQLRTVYAGYVFLCLFLSGLWNQLFTVHPLVPAGLGGLIFWLGRDGGRETVLLHSPRKRKRNELALGLALGGLIWLPALIFFGMTYRQEFPLLGDHTHHLWTTLNVLAYWRSYALPVVGFSLCLGVFVWKWRKPGAWPWIVFAFCLGMSAMSPVYPFLGRYPSGFYFLAAPLQWLFQLLGWTDILNANRWVTVLSVGAWLFLFRPFFLGRWPDWAIFPVAVFLFFQKDMIYYATSSYLDVSAVGLVLLGMEAAWIETGKRGKRPWLGVLLCGLACMFKEQAIFAVPVALVMGYGWKPSRASLTALAVAVAPFAVYWAFRGSLQMRQLSFGSWAELLSVSRFEVFWARLFAQFHVLGLLAVFVALGALAWQFWRIPGLRRPLFLCFGAALAVEVVTFLDQPSSPWTGYPRHEWNLKRERLLIGLSLCLGVFQLVPTITAFHRELSSDFYRGFVEHFDTPLYYPIRALVEKAERAGLLKSDMSGAPSKIWIEDPVAGHMYGGWLFSGYQDLMKRHLITTVGLADADCGCSEVHPNLLVGIVYRNSGIYREFPAEKWRDRDLRPCAERVEATCKDVVRASAPDGVPVGVFGIGAK